MVVNIFNEAYVKVQQGGHFYTQLASYIGSLGQTVSDFVMCRNLEKDELVEALDSANPQPPPPQNAYVPASIADFEVAESQIFSLPSYVFIPKPDK